MPPLHKARHPFGRPPPHQRPGTGSDKPNVHVDFRSGQVFSETTVHPAFSEIKGAAWVHESPFLPPGWGEGSPMGADSLVHMALHRAISDQRCLTADTLRRLPFRLGALIWGRLGSCRKQTMYMWKLMATAYPRDFRDFCPLYRVYVDEQKMHFSDYIKQLTSPSLRWGTVLTVTTEWFDQASPASLSNITNLMALDISTPLLLKAFHDTAVLTPLTNRVIRSWAELAAARASFKYLRVVILRSQHEVTEQALAYFAQFPALAALAIINCPRITGDGSLLPSNADDDPGSPYAHAQAIAAAQGWDLHSLADRTSTTKTALDFLQDYYKATPSVPATLRSLPLLEFTMASCRARPQAVHHIYLFTRDLAAPAARGTGPVMMQAPAAKRERGGGQAEGDKRRIKMARSMAKMRWARWGSDLLADLR